MKLNPISNIKFKISNKDESTISIKKGFKTYEYPGLWPIVDENLTDTKIVAYGNKEGYSKEKLENLRSILGMDYKIIHNSRNGPFFIRNYNSIIKDFDAFFARDYYPKNHANKEINLTHSMIVRSMPYKNLFWEPVKVKNFDYSLLTWGPSDKVAKKWDTVKELLIFLSRKGLRGVIVTQRGDVEDLVDSAIKNYVDNGLLTLKQGDLNEQDFHSLVASAKVSLFPNTLDAFPKHIIESLLADKRIVFSKDLLFGSKTLKDLGREVSFEVDFNDNKYYNKIYEFIVRSAECNPRELWLENYSFDKISKIFANDLNYIFETNFDRVFFLNHIPRLKENTIK